MASFQNIIIVGAGPAGLLLALLLAKAGIRVSVLEKESQPTDETRAVFYQPVSFFEFKRAGVFDDVMQRLSIRDLPAGGTWMGNDYLDSEVVEWLLLHSISL